MPISEYAKFAWFTNNFNMNYNEFSIVSGFLDPLQDQGPVLIKADTMARIPSVQTRRLCNLFFNGREHALITRNDIFRARRGNIELFLLSVLFWGFPNNQKGRCTAAMNNWDSLVEWTRGVRNHKEMTAQAFTNLFPSMDAIRGIGISTFSKILYFLGASIDGYRCVILDDILARGVSNLVGREFEQIRMAVIGRYRYYRYYPQYISVINNLANENHIPEDNMEYALWLAGKKNR